MAGLPHARCKPAAGDGATTEIEEVPMTSPRTLVAALAAALVLAGVLRGAPPAVAGTNTRGLQATLVPTGGADGGFGHAVAVSPATRRS
jgi:hypothetical protein